MGEDKVVMVERSIVHLIHHLDEKLTPSDDELDLTANDKLREYFNDQVKNALGDPQTASARFSTDDDQSAITQCYRILGNPRDFIPASRELARLLMKAMGTDARIKPDTATIATCIYTDDSQSGTKFLALIKLDPSVGFVEKVVPVKGGGQIVTFDVVNNVMPTKEVKLRKAALIPPKGTVPNLDLYLLDRQAVGVAANFFGKTFLNTVFALDPVASVKTFFSAADKTRRTLMKAPEGKPERIGPNESDAFVRHFENALLKGHVNKRKFVEDAPLPPEGKILLKKHLDKQFAGDTQIKLDRKYARDEFLTKIRYRGDRAFLLEFEAAHEKEVIRGREQDPDDSSITLLTVAVKNLHRIT